MIQIWIDADSCPTLVRNHTVKIAAKNGIKVFFVANKNIPCDEKPFEMIICQAEKDAADNYIFEHAGESDLVITRDIIFADRLVEKGIAAINDRGTSFTKDNIKDLLSDRDFDFALFEAGVVKRTKDGYSKKDFEKFANCFDRILQKLLSLSGQIR
ncbi:DUF188 domain-containing protein [Treponema sp. C6A8]|uniref:YaiI/YqxD family protein n=1 Tax=Treponema sp. C6A8 TaxID=1410609 RepID=UPI000683ED82|nr:DUF188 domain-containing protein [Treponema sp. C6A8]